MPFPPASLSSYSSFHFSNFWVTWYICQTPIAFSEETITVWHCSKCACAPTEVKSSDTNDNFYEELEHIDQFPKYPMKILLDFSAKEGSKDVFKLAGMTVYMKLVSVMC